MTNLTVNGTLINTDKLVIQDMHSGRTRAVLPVAVMNYVLSNLSVNTVSIPTTEPPKVEYNQDTQTLTFYLQDANL